MQKYLTALENFWPIKGELNQEHALFSEATNLINSFLAELEEGNFAACVKTTNGWQVNEWVKKMILLSFRVLNMRICDGNYHQWYDKIPAKFSSGEGEKLIKSGIRLVPGAFVRKGTYIAPNVVIMPSFVNIGAHIGSGSLIDSWATIGSCAHIGKNCHISGGVGIGGVLEPLQARPVIIEDNCFIGARSEIAEGIIIEEGAVISMGNFISASTKIIDRHNGEIIYGRVPAYSVIVPGVLPASQPHLPGLACAVIVKRVDKKTREKTSINELLRA